MKLAQIADIHLGLNYPGPTPESRFDDITRVMDWSADVMIQEKCELVLVAGDMFKDARVFLDRASREITAAAAWIRKLTSASISVVIISGTPSHDAISAYELLKEMRIPGCQIATTVKIINAKGLRIACLPGMNRGAWASREEYKHLPPQEIHQLMTKNITDLCQSMTQSSKVLMAHLTYDMADKGFEDVLMQHEPVLTQEAVHGYDLVCLGHIHRPQQNGPVFYCGSPERLTFNDEDITPGFWIYDYEGCIPESHFIKTPARKFTTWKWTEQDIELFISTGIAHGSRIDGDIVRLFYDCPEALYKQLNRKALEKALYDRGAFFVTEITGSAIEGVRDREQEVTNAMDPIEALQKWCDQPDIKIPPEELPHLLAMAGELLRGAE